MTPFGEKLRAIRAARGLALKDMAALPRGRRISYLPIRPESSFSSGLFGSLGSAMPAPWAHNSPLDRGLEGNPDGESNGVRS